jgi:subfamily B ATP-binding cassette protein MsbA
MSKQSRQSDWRIYRRLLSNLDTLWPLFLVSILGYMLYSASQVLVADWSQFVIDTLAGEKRVDAGIVSGFMLRHFSDGETTARTLHAMIAISVLLLAVIRGVGYFLGNYYMSVVSNTIVHKLRCQVFDKMLVVPSSYYDKSSTGNLLAKVTYHVSQVTGAATDAIKIIIREGTYAIGLLAYLFYKQWEMTLIFMVVLPIIGLLVNWVGKQFRRISRKIQDSVGDVTQVANEAIGGYKEVRSFGGRDYESSRFELSSRYNLRQNLKLAFYSAISSPVIQMLVWTAMAVLVWVALDRNTGSTAGEFVAYVGAAGMLAKPIRQLSEVLGIIQKGLAACEDLYEFIDSPDEPDSGRYVTERARGKIEFRDVSFAYEGSADNVLSNISFTAAPGETVALVGLSGSGKSTLVSLITRFYEYGSGEILLDDVNIKDYQLTNLRDQIAVVTQQVTLFNDTVFNNIAYGGLAGASREAVNRAAIAANAIEYISALPLGMETVVGEDGVMLSGGQRQRLAIARAILKDAPVLILDEATSALDNKAEYYIQEALQSVMEDRTSLVIAHRLSTIENADLILVMEGGRIVERGSHSELLALGEHYAALHARNFESSPENGDDG